MAAITMHHCQEKKQFPTWDFYNTIKWYELGLDAETRTLDVYIPLSFPNTTQPLNRVILWSILELFTKAFQFPTATTLKSCFEQIQTSWQIMDYASPWFPRSLIEDDATVNAFYIQLARRHQFDSC